MSVIDEVIGQLDTEEGVVRACETIGGLARQGHTADLLALARALEEKASDERRAAFETAADHVEDQLALVSGKSAVEAVLALARTERVRSVQRRRAKDTRQRALASRLGYGQTKETFFVTLEREMDRPEHAELLAVWMHELVLRGETIEGVAVAQAFHARLATSGHPLASMPLALSPVEREAPSYMPLYGDRGLGRAIATLQSGPMSARTVPPPAAGTKIEATPIDAPDTVARLSAAVAPWIDPSNGKVEARLFSLAAPLDFGMLGAWLLRALPLDCTAESPRLDVSRTGAEAVFGSLFAAASNGGAYSSGFGGAYGRRAAWTSLGALVDTAAGASIADIERAAEATAFLTFRAPGPWFYDVAWDLGALALRAGGRDVAVLAATDTD